MTKRFLILISLVLSLFLVGCRNKNHPATNDYFAQNQSTLKDLFLYSGDYQTIAGVSELGKTKKELYLPQGTTKILAGAFNNLQTEKIIIYSKNNIVVETNAINNFKNLEITFIGNFTLEVFALSNISNLKLSVINASILAKDNKSIIANSNIESIDNFNSNLSLINKLVVISKEDEKHINYINGASLADATASLMVIDHFAGLGQVESATKLDLTMFTSIGKYAITNAPQLTEITLSSKLKEFSNLSIQNTSLSKINNFSNELFCSLKNTLFLKINNNYETILLTSESDFDNIENHITIGTASANNLNSLTASTVLKLVNSPFVKIIKKRAFINNTNLNGTIEISNLQLEKIEAEIFWGTNETSFTVINNCPNSDKDWNKRV